MVPRFALRRRRAPLERGLPAGAGTGADIAVDSGAALAELVPAVVGSIVLHPGASHGVGDRATEEVAELVLDADHAVDLQLSLFTRSAAQASVDMDVPGDAEGL